MTVTTRSQHALQQAKKARHTQYKINVMNDLVNNPLFKYLADENSALVQRLDRVLELNQLETHLLTERIDILSAEKIDAENQYIAERSDNQANLARTQCVLYAVTSLLDIVTHGDKEQFFYKLREGEQIYNCEVDDLEDYDSDITVADDDSVNPVFYSM